MTSSFLPVSLLSLGAVLLLAAPVAAHAVTGEEHGGEILQVSYPEGTLSLKDVVPGGSGAGRSVVVNTADDAFEVAIASDWADTAAAEAGVMLAAEICAGVRLEGECTAPVREIELGTEFCVVEVIGAGESWDIRFTATLPEGAGNEVRGLTSPFAVDFAVAEEVQGQIIGGETGPGTNTCPPPQEVLLPDGSFAPPAEQADSVERGSAVSSSPSVGSAGQSGHPTAGGSSKGDGVDEIQKSTKDELASTGVNAWAAGLFAIGLLVLGAALVRRRRSPGG